MAEYPASIDDTEAKRRQRRRESQKTAPRFLIEYANNLNWYKGKLVLKQLLSKPSMKEVWMRLGRKFKTDAEWRRLWQEILYALQKANDLDRQIRNGRVLESRSTISDGLNSIAKDACSLARKLDTYQIDLLAFDCCPSDFKEDESNCAGAFAWLSVKDILHGLAREATERKPDTRSMTRKIKEKHPRETEFSKRLYAYLLPQLTDRSDNIYATIATIGAVAMDNSTISPEMVKSACRPRNR